MKTEFVDVSDTRKQLLVEIPSTVVDAEIDRIARDYGKAARIPGFRPGEGAGQGRAHAVSRPDPPRRRPRPDSPRRGQRAAGTGRRAGGHARHQERAGRGRPAAEVHGRLRDRAGVRPGRLRVAEPEEAGRLGDRRRRGGDPGAAAAAGGALRAGRRPSGRGRRHRRRGPGARGAGRGRRPPRERVDRDRGIGQPARASTST